MHYSKSKQCSVGMNKDMYSLILDQNTNVRMDVDYRFPTMQFYHTFVKNTVPQNLVKPSMVQNQKLSQGGLCGGRFLQY